MPIDFKKIGKDEFPLIYSDMQKQFPQSELKPYEIFLKLIDTHKYKVYAAHDDGNLVGYVVVAEIEDVIWLDYIAVLKEFHSNGYGAQILGELENIYADKTGCLFEVEVPDVEELDTLRRIKFYKNLGAQKLPIDYFYPNAEGSIKMHLYAFPYKSCNNLNYREIIKGVFELIHSDLLHRDDVLAKICESDG